MDPRPAEHMCVGSVEKDKGTDFYLGRVPRPRSPSCASRNWPLLAFYNRSVKQSDFILSITLASTGPGKVWHIHPPLKGPYWVMARPLAGKCRDSKSQDRQGGSREVGSSPVRVTN